MNLIFLGTGPAEAIPRKGHRDVLCRNARRPGSPSRRMRSSALLYINDRRSMTSSYDIRVRSRTPATSMHIDRTCILFDASPDILKQWQSVTQKQQTMRLPKPQAIFLTHGHSDASHGITHLHVLAKHGLIDTPMPVYTEAATMYHIKKRLSELGLSYHKKFVEWRKIVPSIPVRIGELNITPLRVLHAFERTIPTVGYTIQVVEQATNNNIQMHGKISTHRATSPSISLAYISDTRGLPAAALPALQRVQTLIIDGTQWVKRIPTHLTYMEAIELGARLHARRVFLTQIGHSYPPHAQAERRVRAYATQIKKKTSPPLMVHIAFDGLTITV